MGNVKRPLEISDLALVEYISSPDAANDGKFASFVMKTAGADLDSFVSDIYEVPVSGGEFYRITSDGGNKELPKYSPDGNCLAFLSDKSGDRQIWVFDRRTRESKMLTKLRHGVSYFTWSNNGKKIAFVAALWPGEENLAFTPLSPMEKAERLANRENSPIVIEDLMYKFDETYGIVDGSYTQIGVLDINNSDDSLNGDLNAKMLTSGKVNYKMPVFSPDGDVLAFYGCPYNDHRITRNQIFVCGTDGAGMRQLTDNLLIPAASPVIYTREGIIYLELIETNGVHAQKPRRISSYGAKTNDLFPEVCECYGIDAMSIGKTAMGTDNPVCQLSECDSERGAFLYFISSDNGAVNLFRFSLASQKIEKIIGGKISIHSFCPPKNGKIIFTRGDTTTIAEVYVFDTEKGTETRLTHTNLWLNEREISTPEEMWVESADKTVKIHGFVVRPAEFKENKKYPAVLDIHGGPVVFYSFDFWFEFQYLAARGMAVVYCDPRGSAGFGLDFQKHEHAWGKNSYDDLMSFLDAAIEKGFIDEKKVGVTGGSYGGMMTGLMITSSNRFAAAVNQRNLCNLSTSYGTGDMGSIRDDKDFKSMLKMLTGRVESRSTIITGIDKIKTPLLILHGTHDYRCSFEQAEQLFIAMKDRNPDVPVKLVAFPGENHNLTRGGKQHFQQAHLKEMADWFELYLKAKEDKENA